MLSPQPCRMQRRKALARLGAAQRLRTVAVVGEVQTFRLMAPNP